MKTHKLKILKKYHIPVSRWEKKCEIRIDDRWYKVGDLIEFSVIDPETPDIVWNDPQPYIITHVLYFPEALKNNYKALSIERVKI